MLKYPQPPFSNGGRSLLLKFFRSGILFLKNHEKYLFKKIGKGRCGCGRGCGPPTVNWPKYKLAAPKSLPILKPKIVFDISHNSLSDQILILQNGAFYN
jgi:hypothetical protein